MPRRGECLIISKLTVYVLRDGRTGHGTRIVICQNKMKNNRGLPFEQFSCSRLEGALVQFRHDKVQARP